ncbi:hypothetical protein ABZP36_015531 [Zizania latifolia]
MFGEDYTFAHGSMELRSSLTAYPGGWRREPPSPPPPSLPRQVDQHVDNSAYGGSSDLRTTTKVCFMFRDTGSYHFREKCTFSYVSAQEIHHPRGPVLSESIVRTIAPKPTPPRMFEYVMPPVASFAHDNSGGYSSIAVEPVSDPSSQHPPRKLTRLVILSRNKMTGIYDDWLEGYPKP